MTLQMRKVLWLSLFLFVGVVLQSLFADSLRIKGAKPDIMLTITLVGAMFCEGNGGAGFGFVNGLFFASIASPPAGGFGATIISRTLVGFGVGWLEEHLFRESLPLAIGIVVGGTLLAEALFFAIAPQPNIPLWFRHLLGETAYNGVLAIPLFFLLKRVIGRSALTDLF